MNKYSHEQYINKLNRLNTTMRPLEDYVGYHNKILHRCNKCGNEEYLAPIQFIYKSVYKCIKCNLYHHTSYKLTQDLYIEKLKLLVNPYFCLSVGLSVSVLYLISLSTSVSFFLPFILYIT